MTGGVAVEALASSHVLFASGPLLTAAVASEQPAMPATMPVSRLACVYLDRTSVDRPSQQTLRSLVADLVLVDDRWYTAEEVAAASGEAPLSPVRPTSIDDLRAFQQETGGPIHLSEAALVALEDRLRWELLDAGMSDVRINRYVAPGAADTVGGEGHVEVVLQLRTEDPVLVRKVELQPRDGSRLRGRDRRQLERSASFALVPTARGWAAPDERPVAMVEMEDMTLRDLNRSLRRGATLTQKAADIVAAAVDAAHGGVENSSAPEGRAMVDAVDADGVLTLPIGDTPSDSALASGTSRATSEDSAGAEALTPSVQPGDDAAESTAPVPPPPPTTEETIRALITEIEDNEADSYSSLQVIYGGSGGGLPPIEELMQQEASLIRQGSTVRGFPFDAITSPEDEVRREELLRAELAEAGWELVSVPVTELAAAIERGEVTQVDVNAVAAIGRVMVQSINDRGIVGIWIDQEFPDDASVDEGDPQPLVLELNTGRVSQLRTVAAGDRIGETERIDHPKHDRIRERAPVEVVPMREAAGEDDEVFDPEEEQRFRDEAYDRGEGLINRDELSDYAMRLSRHPNRRVDIAIAPGVNDTAVVDLLVQEQKQWTIFSQVSNTGTASTSEWRQRFGFFHTQFTGNDDVFAVEYITA
ncbi:MAG: hypothetical protein ACOC0P_03545, partial [Planctomycetota bacterium]